MMYMGFNFLKECFKDKNHTAKRININLKQNVNVQNIKFIKLITNLFLINRIIPI